MARRPRYYHRRGCGCEGAYICPSTRNKNVVQGALYHGEDRKVESGASLLMSVAKNMASVRPGGLPAVRASPPRHTDKRCLIKTLARRRRRRQLPRISCGFTPHYA